MATDPWLTIIGVGEDGPDGLSTASWAALRAAEIVIGAERHLQLIGELDADCQLWPVPFADGIDKLLALRGRRFPSFETDYIAQLVLCNLIANRLQLSFQNRLDLVFLPGGAGCFGEFLK